MLGAGFYRFGKGASDKPQSDYSIFISPGHFLFYNSVAEAPDFLDRVDRIFKLIGRMDCCPSDHAFGGSLWTSIKPVGAPAAAAASDMGLYK